MFLYAVVWAVSIIKSSFSLLREVLVFLSRCWRYSDGDTGCLALVPGGGPKGLPYIIHYALAHQTGCKAALLWSYSKKALVISLPLGGQLLEQKRQKLQSTPPCSDCSEVERKKETEREREKVGGRGAYFLAWRDIDSIAGSLCVWFLAQDVQNWGEWGLYRRSSFSETCSFITQSFIKQENILLWWNVSYYINTSSGVHKWNFEVFELRPLGWMVKITYTNIFF